MTREGPPTHITQLCSCLCEQTSRAPITGPAAPHPPIAKESVETAKIRGGNCAIRNIWHSMNARKSFHRRARAPINTTAPAQA